MSDIPYVTNATFDREVLEQKGTVLVDFTASWCPPCRALEPVLEVVARELGSKLKIVKVDTDASADLANRYGVRAAPTLVVFRDGERHAVRVGAMPKEKLLALVTG